MGRAGNEMKVFFVVAVDEAASLALDSEVSGDALHRADSSHLHSLSLNHLHLSSLELFENLSKHPKADAQRIELLQLQLELLSTSTLTCACSVHPTSIWSVSSTSSHVCSSSLQRRVGVNFLAGLLCCVLAGPCVLPRCAAFWVWCMHCMGEVKLGDYFCPPLPYLLRGGVRALTCLPADLRDFSPQYSACI
jgi:hypothetical protein